MQQREQESEDGFVSVELILEGVEEDLPFLFRLREEEGAQVFHKGHVGEREACLVFKGTDAGDDLLGDVSNLEYFVCIARICFEVCFSDDEVTSLVGVEGDFGEWLQERLLNDIRADLHSLGGFHDDVLVEGSVEGASGVLQTLVFLVQQAEQSQRQRVRGEVTEFTLHHLKQWVEVFNAEFLVCSELCDVLFSLFPVVALKCEDGAEEPLTGCQVLEPGGEDEGRVLQSLSSDQLLQQMVAMVTLVVGVYDDEDLQRCHGEKIFQFLR